MEVFVVFQCYRGCQGPRCKYNNNFSRNLKVPLRIGIHVGELFFEENKVMGDSVNVASRIQSLACANSILFSKEVFDKLKTSRNTNLFLSENLNLKMWMSHWRFLH